MPAEKYFRKDRWTGYIKLLMMRAKFVGLFFGFVWCGFDFGYTCSSAHGQLKKHCTQYLQRIIW